MSETFRPRIVVFACNYCSYPGADAAGIARIAQSPHFRIVRTMCSGRVDPAFVLHAFERGADGALITGCHPGDCHFLSGNESAVEQFNKLKRVVELLGIGEGRIGLEWISAGEGSRFATVVNTFVEQIQRLGPVSRPADGEKPEGRKEISLPEAVRAFGALACLDCGKCTGICPIASRRPDYSPRRTVARAVDGNDAGRLEESVWACRTCALCESVCPAGVRYSELIRSLRTAPRNSEGLPRLCRGGALASAVRLQTGFSSQQKRLDWVGDDLRIAREGEVLFWVGCLPYFDAVFSDLQLETIEIARSAIRILNRLGIEPVLLPDEKCCGHDLLWSGDRDGFERLAAANVDQIRKSGARTILFACPECAHTFAGEYAGRGLRAVSFQHLAEFIAPRMGELPLKEGLGSFTFQDPCRLGRMMGVFEEPRKVLRSLPGAELREMERSGRRSVCCSGTGFMGCDAVIKQIQRERLEEARAAGTETLVTACPKCQIHFRCAQKDPFWADRDRVTVRDLATVVASALEPQVPEPAQVGASEASPAGRHYPGRE